MTLTKAKSAKASGMEDSATDQRVNELTQKLQNKLQSYASLADKVKRRNLFQSHLDKIQSLTIEPQPDFEVEQESDECIILKIGYRDQYAIKNRELMEQVRGFIVEKIHAGMAKLDSEIVATEI
jgi:hypothetical protein